MKHESSQIPFSNSNLFSNHYLGKLVQANPEWHEEPGLEDAFQRINDLFQRKSKVLENYNESQLEENFIRPVLRILGHFFGVQGKVQKKDRTPDYAFFPDQESLNEADACLGAEDYYKRAVAVGDAKSWKVSLDKRRTGRGEFEMQNPSFQIDVYLRDTPPKWAVLTNGRLWRLYHESTSYKLDVFYEVDLPRTRVEACLPKDAKGNFIPEQEKSDVVHDHLAFLAERMLEMNKQKQQEIKGFLGWLEGYVGAKVEDLSPKTKIQSYYDHDYEDFLAVLKKNKKKLQIDPSRREPAEALQAEFQASVQKLRPLRDRIERTDRLIDDIVYRLYGLTEEEIAIVEGGKTESQ